MALPGVFESDEPTDIFALKSEGTLEPNNRYLEPGMWWNCERKDLCDGFYCAVTSITDVELTGDDPSTGTWTITVTPITTQNGPASADGMGPASISFPASGTTLANTVLGLIQASEDGANLLTPQDVDNWNRFRSYVALSVSPTGATHLRFTSVASGMTFDVAVITPIGAGGDSTNSSSTTVIAEAGDSTVKVGTYVGVNRTKGTNGRTESGQYFLKEIEASTPEADIVGPVFLGSDTEPLANGAYKFREYGEGSMVPFAHYGVILAYGEVAISAASIGGVVYVRNTVSGDLITGLAADQATAEAAATAAIVTATPVPVNDTQYALDVVVDGVYVGQLQALGDGTATAIEIADAFRADLTLKGGFGGLVTADAAGSSPVVFSGPADGRSLDMTNAATVAGDAGPVPTAGSSSHIRFNRDTFAANSLRPGSVPVAVPHP